MIIALLVLSLLFAVSSFAWSWAGLLIIVALILLMLALEKMIIAWRPRRVSGVMWVWGFFYFLFVMSWLLDVDTTSWSAIKGLPVGFLLAFVWTSSAAVMALGLSIFGYILAKLRWRLDTSLRNVLLLPALWIVSEWFRSILFSVYSWGHGASIGPYWNFGTIGFAVSSTPLAYAGRLVGLYGLSVMAILIARAIIFIIQRAYTTGLIVLLITGTIALIGYFAYSPLGDKSQTISVVQLGNVQVDYHQDLLKDFQAHHLMAADLMVLPEYSTYYEDYVLAIAVHNNLQLLKPQGLSVDSMNIDQGLKPHKNQTFFRRQDGSVRSKQDKKFIIPTGETMPAIFEYPLRWFGLGGVVRQFYLLEGVQPGKQNEHPVVGPTATYGGLACSGAIAPELYRRLVSQGAQVLTNSASLNMFVHSNAYKIQAQQMSRFMSVANARPFAQAARGGFSYIMDRDGNVVASTTNDQLSIVQASVATGRNRTVYSLLGEVLIYLSLLYLLYLVLVAYQRGPSSSTDNTILRKSFTMLK